MNETEFPLLPSQDEQIVYLKSKGLKKQDIKRHLSRQKFYNELITESVPKVIETHYLRRKNFRFFIQKSRRRCLSKFNCKRILIDKEANDLCLFTYPLHFKKFLDPCLFPA